MFGFVTTKKIGSGSYSKVFETSKEFAVKVQPKNEDVYIIETAILNYLKHPNIASSEGYIFESDDFHIIMNKADSSLTSLIKNTISEKQITKIAFQLLHATAYMHEKNIIHRDLKPANILIYGNQIKICDFGLAKYFTYRKRSKNSFNVQTVWYRSPEVTLKKKYDFKADIWSIGAIILEMLGNEHFFIKRQHFMSDSTVFKHHLHEYKFIFKWFSYLLGSFPDSRYFRKVPKRYTQKFSSLDKLCRFDNSNPLVNLALQLMNWTYNERPTAYEALQHPCFKGITNIEIPRNMNVYKQSWYNYNETNKKNITWEMRYLLFDWLRKLNIEMNLNRATLVIAYALVDRFLKCTSISKKDFQLIGVVCLSIASKLRIEHMDSNFPPLTKELIYWCGNKYKEYEFLNMENKILHAIDFDIIPMIDSILKYKLTSDQWDTVCCILLTKNPGSIETIINMKIKDILKRIEDIPDSLALKKLFKYI